MPNKTSLERAKRLARNPLYRKMCTEGWKAATTAKAAGYESVSSFYQALRFEKTPDETRLAKIAGMLGVGVGELYELWKKEAAR